MRSIRFAGVLARLHQWRDAAIEGLSDPASKPDALRLKLQIEDAIACLRLCEEHGIAPGSKVVRLPETQTRTPSSEYRVVEDRESDRREDWIEVEIDGSPLRPMPGSLLIETL